METKVKKQEHYIWGMLSGFIGGLIVSTLIVAAYVYTDFLPILILTFAIAFCEYYCYKLLRGKIDKKITWILIGITVVNVAIMSFLAVPIALLIRSGITVDFSEIGNLYKNTKIEQNILQDFLLSFVLGGFGAYVVGKRVNRSLFLKTSKIKIFKLDNKEKQDIKEVAIKCIKPVMEKNGATEREKALKKEDILEDVKDESSKAYFEYLHSLRVVKKYKGKYFYDETAENNSKIYSPVVRNVLEILIVALIIVIILLVFGMSSSAKKKVYNNEISFSIDNTWNEYKENQDSYAKNTDDTEDVSTENVWLYYKYMNIDSNADANSQHDYPELINVSYGKEDYADNMTINDLRGLLEAYFYEYVGYDDYNIEVFTTDNGYDAMSITIKYESCMEFDYYILNKDNIAYVTATSYSSDEDVYDSLTEYAKDVVNSFKWNN